MEITNAELQNQESTASVESLNVSALATNAVAGAENESLEVDGGADSAQATVLAMSDSEEDGANVDYQGLIHDAEIIRDETGEGENTALRVGTLFLDILRYLPNVNGGHKLLKQWSQLEGLTADEIENQYVPNAYLAKDLYDRIKSGGDYLSKVKDDIANGHITFQKGLTSNGNAIFNSGIQISGNAVANDGMQFGESFDPNILTGFGGKIDGDGNGTLESLTIRRFLEVPELRYNRVEVKVGDKWRAAGAGIIESITTNADGTGTADLKLEDGEIGLVAVGDLCMGIFHDFNGTKNATADSDDSKGNRKFAGFYTCYFRIEEVSNVGTEQNKRITYRLRKSDGSEGSWSLAYHPSAAMHFVVYGNNAKNSAGAWLHPERQSSVYETRTYTRMLRNQTDWEITESNIALQYGDMSNLSIHGMCNMSGYSIYLNNVYVKGNLRHVKDSGEDITQINFLLSAPEDGHYNYYDAISYNGSSYICVNKNGTNTQPSDHDPTNWQIMAEKGSSLSSNGRYVAGTHYPKGSIVNFADAVWVCNEDTDLAPYDIYMTTDGKYLQYADGGYALVSLDQSDAQKAAWGKMFDTSGIKDGENGKDGASLEVQYSADGSSWHTTFASGDLYMRQRLGSGAWSSAMRIVGENGTNGENGEDGQYQDFQFAIGQSLTTQPTTDLWHDAPPTVPSGYYLWMRTRVVYPDGTTSAWSYTRIGGETGNGVEGVTEWYLATSQQTGITFDQSSHDNWSSSIPSNFGKDNKYLWNVEQTTYTKSNADYTDPAIVAVWSKDGKGIKQIKEFYLATNVSSGVKRTTSGWTNAVQFPSETNRFLWNYEQVIYTEGEDTFTDPAIIGVYGERGKDGETLVKNLGLWNHNTKVGYLEIVRMINGTFQCINQNGTTRPPYGCYTTTAGEYLRFSDGGYVLNGEENFGSATSDYALVAMDGEQGKTGENGADGLNGDQVEYVYYRSNKAAVPTIVDESHKQEYQSDDYLPKDSYGVSWTDNPQGVTESMPYEFVAIRRKSGGYGGTGATWGKFSNVTLWSKYGEKGQDGDGVEYVFFLTKNLTKPSCTYNTSDPNYQGDDYLPTDVIDGKRWTDDPSGTTETYKYEWVSQRKYINGVWGAYSEVALWAKYSVDGKDGKDGTNGANLVRVDNYYAWGDSGTTSPSISTGANIIPTKPSDKNYLWNKEVTYNDKGVVVSTTDPTCIGYFPKDGTNGVGIAEIKEYYQLTTNATAPSAPTLSADKKSVNIGLWTTTQITTTAEKRYLWNVEVVKLTDGTYTIGIPHSAGVQGVQGEAGPQGVEGKKGENGKTYYTWIRYADDASGSGISNSPNGKEYIGFAYNKDTATESSNPSDYTWSLIKGEQGEQGVEGAKGENGKTYYTWIKYSNYADGTSMYDIPTDDTKYIGIAVNNESREEGSNKSDYTWSLFRGADGASASNLGEWTDGMSVPYLGIVRMNGRSYQCINKNGCSTAPVGYLLASDGSRLLLSDGTYVIFDDIVNYVLVTIDGDNGEKGEDGASIVKVDNYYAWGENGTTAPDNWSAANTIPSKPDDKDYLWNYEVCLNNNNELVSRTNPACIGYFPKDGVNGTNGENGVGIAEIYELYQRTSNNVVPDAPTLSEDQKSIADFNGWSTTELVTDKDHRYLWNVEIIKLTNGIFKVGNPHAAGVQGEENLFGQLSVSTITMQVDADGKSIKDQSFAIGVTIHRGMDQMEVGYIDGLADETYYKFSKVLSAETGNYSGIIVNVKKGAEIKDFTFQIGTKINGVKKMVDVSFNVAASAIGYTGCSVRAREWSETAKEFTRTMTKHCMVTEAMAGESRYYFKVDLSKIVGRVRLEQITVKLNGSTIINNYPNTEVMVNAYRNTYKLDTGAFTDEDLKVDYNIEITTKIRFLDCTLNAGYSTMSHVIERDDKRFPVYIEQEEHNTKIIVDSESYGYDSANVIRNYYYNESSDADKGYGTRYIDIVLIDNAENPMGYDAYRCKQSHFANQQNKPNSTDKYTSGSKSGQYIWKDYWEEADVQPFIQTDMLFAKHAKMRFASGNQILLQNESEQVIGGMSGYGTDSDQIRLWVGAETPSAAPFRVSESGDFYASNAEIHGKVASYSDGVKVSELNGTGNGTLVYYYEDGTIMKEDRFNRDSEENLTGYSTYVYNRDGSVRFVITEDGERVKGSDLSISWSLIVPNKVNYYTGDDLEEYCITHPYGLPSTQNDKDYFSTVELSDNTNINNHRVWKGIKSGTIEDAGSRFTGYILPSSKPITMNDGKSRGYTYWKYNDGKLDHKGTIYLRDIID